MWKTMLIASLLGGLIVYLWGAFSWMVLPFHKNSMHQFRSEWVMAKTVQLSAPKSGIYIIPNGYKHADGLSKDEIKQEMEKAWEAAIKGPFVFAAVQLEGKNFASVGLHLMAFLTQVVGAFLISCLLLQTKHLTYLKRAAFVGLIGLVGGWLCYVPASTWWGFPAGFIALALLDLIVGWFLAGLYLAKVVHYRS